MGRVIDTHAVWNSGLWQRRWPRTVASGARPAAPDRTAGVASERRHADGVPTGDGDESRLVRSPHGAAFGVRAVFQPRQFQNVSGIVGAMEERVTILSLASNSQPVAPVIWQLVGNYFNATDRCANANFANSSGSIGVVAGKRQLPVAGERI